MKKFEEVKARSIELVDGLIEDLLADQDSDKHEVSKYLPEEFRGFTWGVRKRVLEEDAENCGGSIGDGINRLLGRIESRSEIIERVLIIKKILNSL